MWEGSNFAKGPGQCVGQTWRCRSFRTRPEPGTLLSQLLLIAVAGAADECGEQGTVGLFPTVESMGWEWDAREGPWS